MTSKRGLFLYINLGGDGKLSKLTVKQQRFADEYIISGNATEAARKAGYSTKTAGQTGNENLKKPHIKSYIDKRLEQLKKDSIAEQDEILQYYTSVMRGKEKDEVLLVVGEGEGVASVEKHMKNVDTTARIKAAELLGRVYGMFRDKLELEGVSEVIIIDDIGDDFEDEAHEEET